LRIICYLGDLSRVYTVIDRVPAISLIVTAKNTALVPIGAIPSRTKQAITVVRVNNQIDKRNIELEESRGYNLIQFNNFEFWPTEKDRS